MHHPAYSLHPELLDAAITDLHELSAAVSSVSGTAGTSVSGGVTYSISGSLDPFLNPVSAVHGPSSSLNAGLHAALDACSESSVPSCWWSSINGALSQFANRNGLVYQGLSSIMAYSLSNSSHHQLDLGIASVETASEATEFFRAAALGFNEPETDVAWLVSAFQPLVEQQRVALFVVREDSAVVGTLMLHLSRADTSRSGIYWVSTLPSRRGRGIATALLQHALAHAATASRSTVVLQSTPMAERLYHQEGFQLLAHVENWLFTG